MSLPIRITVDDIQALCSYLVTKPTGATLKETRGVVDKKHLDFRKLVAMKEWHLISEVAGKYKITGTGSDCVRSEAGKVQVLSNVIRETPPYLAVLERVALRHEDAMTATDVAAHWYDHFKDAVSGSAAMLNGQAVVFLQVAAGAGFGRLIIGRKGQPTRFGFNMEAVTTFVSGTPSRQLQKAEKTEEKTADEESVEERADTQAVPQPTLPAMLGQGIFVAHGKNEKPLEQLKKILEQFRIPYRVAVEEPNLSRPISGKVREIMKSCNCAILIFSADEEFKDKDGNTIWRPSENVVNELGATAFLYDNRIVIMREEGVTFPTNFRDIGFISFEKDQLDAKTLDILKELIGFGIVKVST